MKEEAYSVIDLGIQLYGLTKELDKDMWGTIEKLKKIGYHSVELLVAFQEQYDEYATQYGKNPACVWSEKQMLENIPNLTKIGLEVSSCHLGGYPAKSVCEYKDKVIEFSKISGIKHFVISYMFSTKEQCELYASDFNEVVEDLTKEGITLSYHNHGSEFTIIDVDGKQMTAMDYFLELCKPEVTLQVDIGWVAFGNADVMSFMKKAGKRVVSIHIKDFKEGFSEETVDESFIALGDGVVNIKEVLERLDKYNNIHKNGIIADQDKSTGNILDDIAKGFENIQNMM